MPSAPSPVQLYPLDRPDADALTADDIRQALEGSAELWVNLRTPAGTIFGPGDNLRLAKSLARSAIVARETTGGFELELSSTPGPNDFCITGFSRGPKVFSLESGFLGWVTASRTRLSAWPLAFKIELLGRRWAEAKLQFRPRPTLVETEANTAAHYSASGPAAVYEAYAKAGLHPAEKEATDQFISSPTEILDLGCGAGREAFAWAQLGHTVLGIDIAKPMIETAATLASKTGMDSRVGFKTGKLSDLNLGTKKFGAIYVASDLYQRVPSRAERIDLLKRLAASLRPEGVLIIAIYIQPPDPLRRRIAPALARLLSRKQASEPGGYWLRLEFPLEPDQIVYKQRFYNPADVEQELEAAGLKLKSQISDLFVARRN